MKTKFYCLLLTILFLGYCQKSFSQDSELSNRLINQMNEITNHTNKNIGIDKPITRNCISSILLEAKKNWDKLTPQAKSVFNPYTTRPVTPNEQVACSSNFCYHYTLTGVDAVSPTDSNSNGIPDYVEQMADVFENVWTQYQTRNYTMPPLDGTAGGSSKYDVYIGNLPSPQGSPLYGVAVPDLSLGDNPQSTSITEFTAKTSYMGMNKDYSWAASATQTAEDALKITAAHEFFHAIQFGTETGNTNFFMEATAAWSEDEIYPNIDDNLQYLYSTFNYPDVALNLNRDFDNSLTSTTDPAYSQHWYGAWIFFRYLSDNTNSDVIRQILNSTIDYYEINAVNNVLSTNYNISFDTVFKYYLTSLDVLSSNSSFAPYTYTKATTYKNSLATSPFCNGVCYEKYFNFTGSQLIHSSLTTTSTTSTFGNGRLMRLGADYFDITANQNFKVRCSPISTGSPIKTMLLKYNLTNGTVVRVEGQLVNGYIETAVADYQNYDAYTLIVYRPDYVANNANSLASEQYVFDIIPDFLSTQSFNEDNVVLYPNPCNSEFFIGGISFKSYELINSLGQIVKSSALNENLETQKISVLELSEGIYYLKLSGLNGILNKKIVVK